MKTKIKYLAFKGIEKKEQILFKSFLNLAKNELEYQVVILKAGHEDEPDILILDESYDFDEDEKSFEVRPTILVGNDVNNDDPTYICRPVQWSDFKQALSQLNIELSEDVEQVDRILPSQIKFVINDHTESAIIERSGDASQMTVDTDVQKFEYDLENLSVDYNSFTSSEYVKVVDDVRKFNEEGESVDNNEAVVLMTDEESSSANSVLIIETNSSEAWDFTLSENTSVTEIEEVNDDEVESETTEEVVLEKKVGLQIQSNEDYWMADNEIIANHQTLFYIKPERDMIYSQKEPGLWSQILRDETLSKLPMESAWQPKNGFKAYSLSCLHWVNALIKDNQSLVSELDESGSYILITWPQFDLIEMDNSLLKLCTMLFVRPETVDNLVTKSGYSRGAVIGLMNACHGLGILKEAEESGQSSFTPVQSSEGVFRKIKNVFS